MLKNLPVPRVRGGKHGSSLLWMSVVIKSKSRVLVHGAVVLYLAPCYIFRLIGLNMFTPTGILRSGQKRWLNYLKGDYIGIQIGYQ